MQSVVKTNTAVWYFDLIPRPYGLGMRLTICYCIVLQSPQQHILDLTLDPLGQWLACACLDGAVCLIPVMALMLVNTCPILTSLDHCFHSERITQIRTRPKPVVACVDVMVRETVYVILYETIERENFLANFKVLWLFANVFFMKFWGVASFGSTSEQSAEVFPMKIFFPPICKSFLLWKFPAIR